MLSFDFNCLRCGLAVLPRLPLSSWSQASSSSAPWVVGPLTPALCVLKTTKEGGKRVCNWCSSSWGKEVVTDKVTVKPRPQGGEGVSCRAICRERVPSTVSGRSSLWLACPHSRQTEHREGLAGDGEWGQMGSCDVSMLCGPNLAPSFLHWGLSPGVLCP